MQLFHKHIKPEMYFACRNSFIYGGGGAPAGIFPDGVGQKRIHDGSSGDNTSCVVSSRFLAPVTIDLSTIHLDVHMRL